MYILSVIPIARGAFTGELMYFTRSYVTPGSLITVPLRSKKAFALVIRTEDARTQKSLLKTQEFGVKKIDEVQATAFFTSSFLQACEETANYSAQHYGQVIAALAPTPILKQAHRLSILPAQTKAIYRQATAFFALQAEEQERLNVLKSYIRKKLKDGLSVILCGPTISELDACFKLFSEDFGHHIILLHSGITSREIAKRWQQATLEKEPVLVLCTPQFLSIPLHNLGSIILDSESSSAYTTIARPYIDYRVFARLYARILGLELVCSDQLLRVETLKSCKDGDSTPLAPIQWRISLPRAGLKVVDMCEKTQRLQPRDESSLILSETVVNLIAKTKEESSQLFLYAHRRGLAPTTICEDCGQIVSCKTCGVPVVLHTTKSPRNTFRCHKCHHEMAARDTCSACGSWRLRALGVGIDRVRNVLKTSFPDIPIFVVSSDSARSQARAREIADEFLKTKGSILLGTEMVIPYITTSKVRASAIVSLDSLFAIPDFRVHGKIVRLIGRISELTRDLMIVQTRKAQEPLFEALRDGDLRPWFDVELEDRRLYNYPPFTLLIKISAPDRSGFTEEGLVTLAKQFNKYSPLIYKSSSSLRESQSHLLIRVARADWPLPTIIEELQSLPPRYIIRVEPETIF